MSNKQTEQTLYINPLLRRWLDERAARAQPPQNWPGRCWVISDGTMGMLSQCLALLRMLEIDGEDIRAVPTPLLRLFPHLAALPGWQLTLGRRPDWLKAGQWPDLLVTCGRRMAGISIGVKRLSRGRTTTIHIQDPKLPPHYFDLLVTPSHDHIAEQIETAAEPPQNVILTTGALNRLSPGEISDAGQGLPAEINAIKGSVCAVMVGGHNKRYRAGRPAFENFGEKLARFAALSGAALVLVPSRRTPLRHLRALTARLGGQAHYLWDGRGSNPYPGILARASYIIVTSDSVNMTTEACITGKPVLSAELAPETGRIARFHQIMRANAHTVCLDEVLQNPARLSEPFAVLDERAKLAAQIRTFFGVKPD